jgi:hypothetical protein
MKVLLPLMIALSMASISCSHMKKSCCDDKAKCTKESCEYKKGEKKEGCDKCDDKKEKSEEAKK